MRIDCSGISTGIVVRVMVDGIANVMRCMDCRTPTVRFIEIGQIFQMMIAMMPKLLRLLLLMMMRIIRRTMEDDAPATIAGHGPMRTGRAAC